MPRRPTFWRRVRRPPRLYLKRPLRIRKRHRVHRPDRPGSAVVATCLVSGRTQTRCRAPRACRSTSDGHRSENGYRGAVVVSGRCAATRKAGVVLASSSPVAGRASLTSPRPAPGDSSALADGADQASVGAPINSAARSAARASARSGCPDLRGRATTPRITVPVWQRFLHTGILLRFEAFSDLDCRNRPRWRWRWRRGTQRSGRGERGAGSGRFLARR